jgi:predicted metal-dependent hydrolase
MGEHLLPGNPPIAVALRRSARARRLSLRVSRRDGTVTLTLPRGASTAEGIAFLRAREAWLRGHLAGVMPPEVPRFGGTVPFEGVALPLVPGPVRRPVLEGGRLVLPPEPALLGPRLLAFLKEAARARLARASDRHAAALGLRFATITLRDTRSRWGSCSAQGNLSYSWRLVMAPPAVLDYVAAHEVAHLARMDHSPAFWAIVARLCPGYARHRAWLRSEGEGLHRLHFGG